MARGLPEGGHCPPREHPQSTRHRSAQQRQLTSSCCWITSCGQTDGQRDGQRDGWQPLAPCSAAATPGASDCLWAGRGAVVRAGQGQGERGSSVPGPGCRAWHSPAPCCLVGTNVSAGAECCHGGGGAGDSRPRPRQPPGRMCTAHGTRHTAQPPTDCLRTGHGNKVSIERGRTGGARGGVTHTPGEAGSRHCTARVAAGTAPGARQPWPGARTNDLAGGSGWNWGWAEPGEEQGGCKRGWGDRASQAHCAGTPNHSPSRRATLGPAPPSKPHLPSTPRRAQCRCSASPAPQNPTAPALSLGTAHTALAPLGPHGTAQQRPMCPWCWTRGPCSFPAHRQLPQTPCLDAQQRSWACPAWGPATHQPGWKQGVPQPRHQRQPVGPPQQAGDTHGPRGMGLGTGSVQPHTAPREHTCIPVASRPHPRHTDAGWYLGLNLPQHHHSPAWAHAAPRVSRTHAAPTRAQGRRTSRPASLTDTRTHG